MSNVQRNIFTVLVVIFCVAIVVIEIMLRQSKTTSPGSINSFADCVAAGYPVAESFPEQCNVPGGGSFVNESQVLTTP